MARAWYSSNILLINKSMIVSASTAAPERLSPRDPSYPANMSLRSAILSLSAFTLALTSAQAEVTLPKILSSHMVLQRDQPIHLWGSADPNEKVSATLQGVTQAATADRLGHWNIDLPPRSAGGPSQLAISGSNKIVLDDILIGDIWFASGQSNMEMPLSGFPNSAVIKNSAAEIASATQPNIRLLLVRRRTSAFPLAEADTDASWTVCSPDTAAKFSAVAYFFGRDISADQKVPIGLIDSTWGGTPAEAWTSLDTLSSDAALMPVFAARARMADQQAEAAAELEAEKREDAAARSHNLPLRKHSWHPDFASWEPSWLFNGMVAPFLNLRIKGVIWYQGESNAAQDRAASYENLFPALIADWRAHWGEGDFPFLFVQIANYNASRAEDWPIIREAQRRTLSVANTGMAVTADIGDPDNIHPGDKQTVGARLALAARALAYHENIEYSGPIFRQTSAENGALRIWFDHANGLNTRGGEPKSFEIAGADEHFMPATARIDGSSVLLSNPQIPAPLYARYGWRNSPIVNLYNAAGLPASPFTSEP